MIVRLCKNCRWYVRTMPDTVLAECTHDGNYVPDYVNGGTRFKYQTCAGVRNDPNMCGPDAKWFEPVQKADPYVDEELKARYERSHPEYSPYENIDQMLDDPRRGQGDKER